MCVCHCSFWYSLLRRCRIFRQLLWDGTSCTCASNFIFCCVCTHLTVWVRVSVCLFCSMYMCVCVWEYDVCVWFFGAVCCWDVSSFGSFYEMAHLVGCTCASNFILCCVCIHLNFIHNLNKGVCVTVVFGTVWCWDVSSFGSFYEMAHLYNYNYLLV